MTRSTLLTIEDLIDELDMGKATLKFILHRFSPRLATQMINDETYYTEPAVTILFKIKKFLDAGMLPGQIEASLAQEAEMLNAAANQEHPGGSQGTIPVDAASASMFTDMLRLFLEKQDRIASAQEALSRVEERKADAMEKRAAAEEKKADAMTNIALALQEMNQRHNAAGPQAMEIAGPAVETLALEESSGLEERLLDTGFDENARLFEDPVPGEDPFKDQDHQDPEETRPSDMDDLSFLADETALTPEDIDDLSSLIDSVSDPDSDLDALESLLEETPPPPETNNLSNEMDNLSELVDADLSPADSPDNEEDSLDDLFSLAGMDTDVPKAFHGDLDDLSRLIEPAGEKGVADLDDLSALIGEPPQAREPMDDLSSLIAPAGDAPAGDLDDLSTLIDTPPHPREPMDDLSLLVGSAGEKSEQMPPGPDTRAQETPSIKPDILPDEDMGKYKAAVMKIIIELKGQGLTAQETTDRLNRDGVATLSGKPAWTLKAIDKIYGFIDSAK